jgi:heterodisulfide reductase subunit A
MLEVARERNVKLLTYAEVEKIEGYLGNFKVTIKKKPRYVIAEKCSGCGVCEEVCPVFRPKEFDENMGIRKAIYIPFPQAVPKIAIIDMEHCIKCRLCEKVCEFKAIDLDQKEEKIELSVGTIIVATGYDQYNPEGKYGYGKYENVITQLQLERLLAPNGPTGGHLVKLSDLKKPESIVMIQCVGSRDLSSNQYCSDVCCMVAIKNAKLIKQEYPDVEVTICYMDIRCAGKNWEEYYTRAREYNIKFIRGNVSSVRENPETKKLIVRVEDTLNSEIKRIEADLVVLSVAMVPSKDSERLASILRLDRSPGGFYKERHSVLSPIDTKVPGIYVAGAAHGPKSVPEAVAHASGAVAAAAIPLIKGRYTIELVSATVDKDRCNLCGLCINVCPIGAITVKDGAIEINEIICKGCGSCASMCPSRAMTVRFYRPKQFETYIDALFAT